MSSVLTFPNLLLALAALVAAGIWAYRTFSKQAAEVKLRNLLLIQGFAESAWKAVQHFAPSTATTVDDKVAEALKKVAEAFAAQTGKPLPEEALPVAKLAVQAAAVRASELGPAIPRPLSPP